MKRLAIVLAFYNAGVGAMEQAVINMPKSKKLKKTVAIHYESYDPEKQEFKISKRILDNYFMQQNQKLEENLMPALAPKVKASKLSDSDVDQIDFEDNVIYEEVNKIVIEALQDAFTQREDQVNALSKAVDNKWNKKQVVVASSIVGGLATIVSSAVALIIHFTTK